MALGTFNMVVRNELDIDKVIADVLGIVKQARLSSRDANAPFFLHFPELPHMPDLLKFMETNAIPDDDACIIGEWGVVVRLFGGCIPQGH